MVKTGKSLTFDEQVISELEKEAKIQNRSVSYVANEIMKNHYRKALKLKGGNSK